MKQSNLIWRNLSTILLLASALFLLPQCANNASSEGGEADTEMAAADEAEAPVHKETDPIARGKELYVSYCQICHGQGGAPGPMADELKVQPPDMTKIAARNGGEFPNDKIFEIIKGGKEIAGHNADNMPIWGDTFMSSEGLASKAEVDKEIGHIVAYLETVQE
jgi:mono/diheme cytochrome c family protein